MCLVHLRRELEQTVKYKQPGEGWGLFEKMLRRLLGDAIRLWKTPDELDQATLASRRSRLDPRLAELIATNRAEANATRLVKRLRRHQGDLFTFLDKAGVPFENNHAERSIRPAVIIRKNSYGNRNEQGADCQAVMMSIFQTLKHSNTQTTWPRPHLHNHLRSQTLAEIRQPTPTTKENHCRRRMCYGYCH